MNASRIFMLGQVYDAIAGQNINSLNLAYTVAENIRRIELPRQMLTKKREEIVSKFAERNENGEIITNEDTSVKIADPEAFSVEWNEFSNQEIDGFELKPIKLSSLITEDIKLSVNQILVLGELLINDMED